MASSETKTEHWPEGVHSITWNEIGKLGFHDMTGTLYWDGKEVETRSIVRLGTLELLLAGIATAAVVGMFVLELARTLHWWGLGTLTTG